ncbi:hypothetical protein LVU62_00300 [Klebsiella variicola subsp. variicola]|uniref:hypothetical protein n=1 Tax=Klebsiella variicola TaxID=244366 RepID=UPI001E4B3988|nr:hypothetical protein [Klebsiella variicola]MCE0291258.1 hypothetical protein [Klebsiella variicola subsp. variicola]
MTNNQLTDAQISNATLIRLIRWADEHKSHYVAAALRELQERRKAEVDNEPVAEVVSIYGDPVAFGEREIRPLVGIQQMPYGTKLYRHAQQPVVPEEITSASAPEVFEIAAEAELLGLRGTYASYAVGWNACRAAILQAGNSPVIPDGYVMVPIEQTEDMLVNGFESEPDESFSDEKDWKEYDAISGCQQATHRAKLCWGAMIAATPKL